MWGKIHHHNGCECRYSGDQYFKFPGSWGKDLPRISTLMSGSCLTITPVPFTVLFTNGVVVVDVVVVDFVVGDVVVVVVVVLVVLVVMVVVVVLGSKAGCRETRQHY